MHTSQEEVIPFLRWAGGKRWLTKSENRFYPQQFNSYFEPFLGSGAVFFFLNPENAVLADSNRNLIETYQSIKDDWSVVAKHLRTLQKLHSDQFYYEERSRSRRSDTAKASQFIYLNRTCFNGLYRVNQKGNFNVPKGTKTSVVLDTDNFELISNRLRNAQLLHSDFADTIKHAKSGDFVFADPPYTVNHNMNGFLQYNEKIFSYSDQIRLSETLKSAHQRGVKFTLTNANHASIRELYEGFSLVSIGRHSIIAGNSNDRKKTDELIITNWSDDDV